MNELMVEIAMVHSLNGEVLSVYLNRDSVGLRVGRY